MCSSSLNPWQSSVTSSELPSILCFQTRDSVAPKLQQWVQLVIASCGDNRPPESRLAAAEVLTSTAPCFLTNVHPILGKCTGWGEGPCLKSPQGVNRHSRLKKREDKNDSMHHTITAFKYIKTLLVPTLIIFHQQLPLFFSIMFPKPFSFCFQKPLWSS